MPHSNLLISCLFAAGLLAGCAPVADEDVIVTETVVPGDTPGGVVEGSEDGDTALAEQCDAEAYRGLIGNSIAATALPEDPMLRAFGVNDIITQDYRPQRTNIVYDAGGTITRVYCG